MSKKLLLFILLIFTQPSQVINSEQGACQTKTLLSSIINCLRTKKNLTAGYARIYGVRTDITFDDIVGNKEIKQQLEPIIESIVNPQKHPQFNSNHTLLFTGPSRTGKTLMTEAVAGEVKRRNSKHTYLIHLHIGELKREGIPTVFKKLSDMSKESGNVILVIDEIHQGNLKQSGDYRALAKLIDALNEINRQKEPTIIVIACTCIPEDIDTTLKVSGVFGRHIKFRLPTHKERYNYLRKELSNKGIAMNERQINSIAADTQGHSFIELDYIVQQAKQQIKIRQSKLLSKLEYIYVKEKSTWLKKLH